MIKISVPITPSQASPLKRSDLYEKLKVKLYYDEISSQEEATDADELIVSLNDQLADMAEMQRRGMLRLEDKHAFYERLRLETSLLEDKSAGIESLRTKKPLLEDELVWKIAAACANLRPVKALLEA